MSSRDGGALVVAPACANVEASWANFSDTPYLQRHIARDICEKTGAGRGDLCERAD
jgi:hypothetical protein